MLEKLHSVVIISCAVLDDCLLVLLLLQALAEKCGLPYREVSFVEAVKLMMGGLWTTGREELKLRKSYTAAAAAVLDKLHAD